MQFLELFVNLSSHESYKTELLNRAGLTAFNFEVDQNSLWALFFSFETNLPQI